MSHWEWDELAIYNGERARGVVHTPEKDARMAEQQERFHRQNIAEWTAAGGHPVDPDDPDGLWIVPRPLGRWERLRWWIWGLPLVRRLRVLLLGCPVCSKPPVWRAIGRGRQRHLSFCRWEA